MTYFKSLTKLALVYRFASFLPDNVRAAFAYLLELGIPVDSVEKLYEYYADTVDTANTEEERYTAVNSLDELSDAILGQYADHEYITSIYNFLNTINNEAESKLQNSVQEHIQESVEQAKENVQYQEGQELAYSGEASVSEDIHKKRERDRLQKAYKRHSPVTREEFLEKQREVMRKYYASSEYAKKRQKAINSFNDAIKKLMQKGLSKEEAKQKVQQEVEDNLRDRIQKENIPYEEAQVQIKKLKDEEIIKYYQSLKHKGKSGLQKLRLFRKREKIRKAYLQELMKQNPEANPEELAQQIKSIPVSEIDAIGERLLGAA